MALRRWFSPPHHSLTSFPHGGLSDKHFPSLLDAPAAPSTPALPPATSAARRNADLEKLAKKGTSPRARARAPGPPPGSAPASYLSPSSAGELRGVTRGQTRSPVRLRAARSQPPLGGQNVYFLVVSVPLWNEGCGLCGCALISRSVGAGHNLRPAVRPRPPEPSPPGIPLPRTPHNFSSLLSVVFTFRLLPQLAAIQLWPLGTSFSTKRG